MGIGRGIARLLLAEATERPFSGRILQLGRQHLFFDEAELRSLASLHSFALSEGSVSKNRGSPLLNQNVIDDGTFFAMLGFDEVESCDISADENPTHVLDFNRDVPAEFHGRYDVIFDDGTLEHIFDFPKSLENIHKLLKVGGRVIHGSPSTNHVDHGFYMFSPTVYFDYYSANKYEICDFKLFEYTVRHDSDSWRIYRYVPGTLKRMSMGGFDRGTLLGIFFTARKLEESDYRVIPQQGAYLARWSDHALKEVGAEQYRAPNTAYLARIPVAPRSRLAGVKAKIRRMFFGKPRPIDAYKLGEY